MLPGHPRRVEEAAAGTGTAQQPRDHPHPLAHPGDLVKRQQNTNLGKTQERLQELLGEENYPEAISLLLECTKVFHELMKLLPDIFLSQGVLYFWSLFRNPPTEWQACRHPGHDRGAAGPSARQANTPFSTLLTRIFPGNAQISTQRHMESCSRLTGCWARLKHLWTSC